MVALPPADTQGSLAESAVPPVHLVSLGMVWRDHVRPPSWDVPIRSLRPPTPRSCCQVATIVRGCLGLTVTAGSISAPGMCVPSCGPPHPWGNGVGPDNGLTALTTCRPWCPDDHPPPADELAAAGWATVSTVTSAQPDRSASRGRRLARRFRARGGLSWTLSMTTPRGRAPASEGGRTTPSQGSCRTPFGDGDRSTVTPTRAAGQGPWVRTCVPQLSARQLRQDPRDPLGRVRPAVQCRSALPGGVPEAPPQLRIAQPAADRRREPRDVAGRHQDAGRGPASGTSQSLGDAAHRGRENRESPRE